MNIWPLTADPAHSVGGVPLTEIAERFGTPVYVLDEEHVRHRCREYRKALHPHRVAYAGKAFLCRAMARWVDEEGLWLDVCSAGELALARSVGFPAERILLHGNGKTPEDLAAALEYGVGRIVVDSAGEVARLAALAGDRRHPRKVLVRVTPGVDPHVHRAMATGLEDQKFGLSLASGAAGDVVRRVLGQPALALAGLHCHLGSQIGEPDGYETAARRLVAFMAGFGGLPELNLGGGHAVAYRPDEHGLDVHTFAGRVVAAVAQECAVRGVPAPSLTVEPGRAIVASAGVTLYRVVAVKHGARTFVVVDGGMSDNPRPALYGSRYSVARIGPGSGAGEAPATVVGRHCEAGDVIAADVPLPADVRPGDLLAVPCTGAYHHSMASNYNQVARPPVVAVRGGRARPLVRRETLEDLIRRDVG
ncbi:diaminopimelate decarboxylase [Actinoallomurus oryzae]|uniref:Diaminopimelate decarboxylase n=1 Tax=Actinoallomurus oryzae TaxID=502180 RepID=A0ABP8PJB4_9ACTN